MSTGLEVAVLDCEAAPLGLAMGRDLLLCGEDSRTKGHAGPSEGEGGKGNSRALLWALADAIAAGAEGTEPVAELVEHKGAVVSVTLSERLAASAGSTDRTARIWRVHQKGGGRSLATLPHPEGVTSVSANWVGTLLVSGCMDGKVYIWSMTSFSNIAVLEHSEPSPVTPVSSVRLVADLVLSGCRAGHVKLWSLTKEGEHVATLHPFGKEAQTPTVQGLAASVNDGVIAVAGDDRLVIFRAPKK
mmetsp:Transcript_15896/g.40967  ORF Transcript_15896/g.40967 Transcript_15896/m.40967 type:complete len:245 (-) Transcript_15896:122-856(-)